MFGSNKNIFNFNNFAAMQKGNDIYPPVLIKEWILFFFKNLKELINDGIDAKNFLNDVLEILYLFSRRINLGPIEKDATISEAEVQLIDQYSQKIDMQDIGLFWQLTIKTIDDLRVVGNENLTLEMFIMQLAHLKNIGFKEEGTLKIDASVKEKDNFLETKGNDENGLAQALVIIETV